MAILIHFERLPLFKIVWPFKVAMLLFVNLTKDLIFV